MAPDAPGNLVVLDLNYDKNGRLLKTVEDVEPAQTSVAHSWLRVRFDEAPSEDFYPVGGGVAFVRQPDNYEHSLPGEKSEVLSLPGPHRYMFTNVAQGEGLQLILILPKGYTVAEFAPTASSAKEFQGRIALYFRPKEKFGETTTVTWGLRAFKGSAAAEAKRLRGVLVRAGNVVGNTGAYVDREDPEFRESKAGSLRETLSARAYAIMALVGLTIGIGLLLFYVYIVPKLVESGSQSQVYYILLIPWALGCAAFLFGTLHSYAQFSHKHLGNALELGGPVVLFCLVLWGGFKLVPPAPEMFDLTVRVRSQDNPVITSGAITIDLGTDRRKEFIGPNGEANFKGIPPRFRETSMNVLPQVDGYKQEWQSQQLQGNVLNLTLARENSTTLLTGSVSPPPGNTKQITILVEGQKAETSPDEFGRFALVVDGKTGDTVRLKVYQGKTLVYDDYQVLPGPITLRPRRP